MQKQGHLDCQINGPLFGWIYKLSTITKAIETRLWIVDNILMPRNWNWADLRAAGISTRLTPEVKPFFELTIHLGFLTLLTTIPEWYKKTFFIWLQEQFVTVTVFVYCIITCLMFLITMQITEFQKGNSQAYPRFSSVTWNSLIA